MAGGSVESGSWDTPHSGPKHPRGPSKAFSAHPCRAHSLTPVRSWPVGSGLSSTPSSKGTPSSANSSSSPGPTRRAPWGETLGTLGSLTASSNQNNLGRGQAFHRCLFPKCFILKKFQTSRKRKNVANTYHPSLGIQLLLTFCSVCIVYLLC